MTPTTNSTEKEEGWVEHDGGPIPLHGRTRIEVEYRDRGERDEGFAALFDQKHDGSGDDIIAYRIVEVA